jgi:hypothetical protein
MLWVAMSRGTVAPPYLPTGMSPATAKGTNDKKGRGCHEKKTCKLDIITYSAIKAESSAPNLAD